MKKITCLCVAIFLVSPVFSHIFEKKSYKAKVTSTSLEQSSTAESTKSGRVSFLVKRRAKSSATKKADTDLYEKLADAKEQANKSSKDGAHQKGYFYSRQELIDGVHLNYMSENFQHETSVEKH